MALAAQICVAAPAVAETRIGLVIGEAKYEGMLTPLTYPHDDADTVAAALSKVGFRSAGSNLKPKYDLERAGVLRAAQDLSDELKAAGPQAIGFFYYSGHGGSTLLAGQRRNFLIPSGARIKASRDLDVDGVPVDTIVNILSDANAQAIFIVLDACRSELPISKGPDDPDKGFEAISNRPGMFIMFATGEGAAAPDDSKFAKALATAIQTPNQTHLMAFDQAARAIAATRADTRRFPWYANQIDATICFNGCGIFVSPDVMEENKRLKDKIALLEKQIAASTTTTGPPPLKCPAQDFVVFFDWDKHTLSPAAMQTVQLAIDRARPCLGDKTRIEIIGHSDSAGSAASNLALSQRMASSVAAALTAGGIAPTSVTATGVGETDPLVQTADGVREPQNRRVTISMTF
jgi:outer membrane protein OmpA-like peptidoglycan-associated protein